tara:strand:- start:2055 stop:2243 length:189 start_codon:yes stop_codon:yes gene_type:complete
MDEINFSSAKYVNNLSNEKNCIRATVVGSDKTLLIPLIKGNRHFDNIMAQVDAGTLTIEEAD